MADVNVVINIEAGGETPKVEVKKPIPTAQNKKHNLAGGVLQFPEMDQDNNAILDLMGIQST
jgi:hypothetical protein